MPKWSDFDSVYVVGDKDTGEIPVLSSEPMPGMQFQELPDRFFVDDPYHPERDSPEMRARCIAWYEKTLGARLWRTRQCCPGCSRSNTPAVVVVSRPAFVDTERNIRDVFVRD